MTRTTLLIPLAASLMLGTAAFAQDEQPNDQQMQQQQQAAPDSAMPQGGAMQNTSDTVGDPRQNSMGGMPIDQETTVNGIQAACTGVGDEQENRARWSAYPVKIVLSGTNHQFFAGETVSVTRNGGEQVAQMTCNGPWVLMKLEPGAYHATVDLPGHPAKTVGFTAPARGQREVNVVYTGAQETSDETSTPRDEHRATESSFTQPQPSPKPQSAPMDSTAPAQPTMDQSPNNSDQPPQQPQ